MGGGETRPGQGVRSNLPGLANTGGIIISIRAMTGILRTRVFVPWAMAITNATLPSTKPTSRRLGEYGSGRSKERDFRGLSPRGYRRPDERIQEEVCERLTRQGQLDASEIEVEVRGGEVTLNGTVDSRSAKRLAETASEFVPGVVDVHNRLRIEKQDGR